MTETDSFECVCCGECCRGDMHVYLNPDDLILIAGALRLGSTYDLFNDGIVIIDYKRNNAPIPRLRFSRGPAGCCPFLENRLEEFAGGHNLRGLCSLHPEFKPLVCWLAPRYRTVNLEADTEDWGFRPPLPGCPGCERADEAAEPVSESLKIRLESEKDFFRRLSEMIGNGCSEDRIIKTLYYSAVDCHD